MASPKSKVAFLCYEEGMTFNSNAGYSQTENFANALNATGAVEVARFAWDDPTQDLTQYSLIFPLEVRIHPILPYNLHKCITCRIEASGLSLHNLTNPRKSSLFLSFAFLGRLISWHYSCCNM
jgi:hypothetical protein